MPSIVVLDTLPNNNNNYTLLVLVILQSLYSYCVKLYTVVMALYKTLYEYLHMYKRKSC